MKEIKKKTVTQAGQDRNNELNFDTVEQTLNALLSSITEPGIAE